MFTIITLNYTCNRELQHLKQSNFIIKVKKNRESIIFQLYRAHICSHAHAHTETHRDLKKIPQWP